MKTILLDKIGSVTFNCRLPREVRIGSEIAAVEGSVIAARVLTSKSTYNTLELPSGRFSQVKPGDVIAGALGHRKALFGYSGSLPKSLRPGDIVQMLNMGGVLGVCDSATHELGKPFDCKVVGVVQHFRHAGDRLGAPVRVGYRPLDYAATLEVAGVPVVAIVGTCMEAGKTGAACAILARMRRRGLNVSAFKATGVSLRRDVLAMEDAGARRSMIFTDLGIVTTTAETGPALTRSMLTELAAAGPDAIVCELGDGILGAYGVEAILQSPDIPSVLTAVVLSANDPVAAWGGVKLLREQFSIEPCVVTGPATDNQVGVEIIERQMGLPAFNALSHGAALGDCVIETLGIDRSRLRQETG